VSRDDFEALLGEAREALEGDLQREQKWLMPDFAAAVEEAHARDPARVPASALAEARELAPVVDLRSDSAMRLSKRDQSEFAALLAEARGDIDADVAAVRAGGAPPMAVPATRSSRTRAWAWVAAAAAVAALAFGVRPLLSRGEATDVSAIQAPWQDQASPPRHEVEPTPEPAPVSRRGAPEAAPEVEPEVEPAVEPEVAPVIAPEPAPVVDEPEDRPDATGSQGQATRTRRTRPAGESAADRLSRLDAEAEALWHSGDLAGAEARYREIVGLAPGSRAADLAYGDLFSLARQRRGADHEAELWREYLKTFPRGRYADDARAGLCRRAEGDERASCWRAYLEEFPGGVHRHQAARVLGESER
jgi:hypothetical protein